MLNDIIKKCRFKDIGVVFHAPEEWEAAFVGLAFKTFLDQLSKNTLVFIREKQDFLNFLTNQIGNIVPDSVLWFAYPKGTSKIKTDINRDILRSLGETVRLTTVSAISIDETWSAIRFRPIEQVGK
jgi:hypothetical protein